MNSLGGYSLYYASNFKSINGATNAFERALSTWRCATLVNFTLKNSAAIVPPTNACRIDMASLPVGTTTTIASTSPTITVCYSTAPTMMRAIYQSRFKISFNNNLLWHTSSTMPTLPTNIFDMQTNATHEIGHAHLLNHSNNYNDLMYFTNLTPPYKRDIDSFDLAGGLWTIKYSTIFTIPNNAAGNTCKPPMIKINPADCLISTEIVEMNGETFNIAVFPTLFEVKITIQINDYAKCIDFQILNTLGQVIKKGQVCADMEQIPLGDYLPTGIYYVNIRLQQQTILTKKIIKK
jgi:hypothetical protein